MEIERVEELIKLMKEEGITELAIETPQYKVSLKRHPDSVAVPGVAAQAAAEPQGQQAPDSETELVTSSAVGTFHLSDGIVVGSALSAGQVVAVIESMRIPHEVSVRQAGVVSEILVPEGAAVEYDQPLMEIVPSGTMQGLEDDLLGEAGAGAGLGPAG